MWCTPAGSSLFWSPRWFDVAAWDYRTSIGGLPTHATAPKPLRGAHRSGTPRSHPAFAPDTRVGTSANVGGSSRRRARVCVFAPAPLLTVTIEKTPNTGQSDEVHLHAGGQGFWIARLVAELGVDVVLCGSFGGETGRVARALINDEGINVRGIDARGFNGAYVHDRRSGDRVETASMRGDALTRHELDELYGIVLLEGIESDAVVLGGPTGPPVLPASTYRRLAIKISEEELPQAGKTGDDDPVAVVEAMRSLADDGADHVVTTRAAEPALALIDGSFVTVRPPRLTAEDHRGAGDSLTAGLAATIAQGGDLIDGLRLGAAAGALNVTRRGLATGRREQIERLVAYVEINPFEPPASRRGQARVRTA
jgi:1-phosphofructokinase